MRESSRQERWSIALAVAALVVLLLAIAWQSEIIGGLAIGVVAAVTIYWKVQMHRSAFGSERRWRA